MLRPRSAAKIIDHGIAGARVQTDSLIPDLDLVPRHEGRPHQVAPDSAARATRRRPGRVPHPLRAPRRRRPRVRRVVRRRLGQPGASASSNRRRSPSDYPTTRSHATCAAASRACSSSRAETCSVASELGHKPSTCLDIYGRLFEEFDPARRRPAVEVIREARKAVRDERYPLVTGLGQLAALKTDALRPKMANSSAFSARSRRSRRRQTL